ncbi:unnamed protein product [Schistosoma mattheei]|uniref:Uncharacterized protein n=1 Tax=Schistosoma mattheei TaxID=31246 RepID=A0A183PWH0_9TREM|nr:unnamed protein product [Schistosoma mattheei]
MEGPGHLRSPDRLIDSDLSIVCRIFPQMSRSSQFSQPPVERGGERVSRLVRLRSSLGTGLSAVFHALLCTVVCRMSPAWC